MTFKKLRGAGVPLVGWASADPAATIRQCIKQLNGSGDKTPLFEWDILNGMTPLNTRGKDAMTAAEIFPMSTLNPSEFLSQVVQKVREAKPPKKGDDEDSLMGCVIFFHLANRFMESEGVIQGIWSARDVFKAQGATLVLLGPAITLPAELKHDVMVINEPLPDQAELLGIIKSTSEDTQMPAVAKQVEKDGAVMADILSGLSAYAAEQVFAVAVNKEGVDMEELWSRKKQMIEQTPGLQVWKGGESFDDLGGLTNLKDFLTSVLTSGKTPVRAIGFIDEVEKALGGSAGDTSGTSQDQLGVLLKVMQDKGIPGIILIGHGGTGKSMIAKAAGTVADAPVISIDLGAMKGSLVGQSEQRIRAAMDVFEAVSQGKGMFIATCNRIGSLPPELRRRFTLGTFMVDLPDAEERKKIWSLMLAKFSLPNTDMESLIEMSDDWTGAEVKACCEVAFRTGKTLKEASKFVVPVIKSAPDQVKALREMANGKFISASKPGIYKSKEVSAVAEAPTGRRMSQ